MKHYMVINKKSTGKGNYVGKCLLSSILKTTNNYKTVMIIPGMQGCFNIRKSINIPH